jgi:hypothetical protein
VQQVQSIVAELIRLMMTNWIDRAVEIDTLLLHTSTPTADLCKSFCFNPINLFPDHILQSKVEHRRDSFPHLRFFNEFQTRPAKELATPPQFCELL